ncbi:hypothetical protein PG984_008488 [Apiospora sp. TS-2023a]
MDPLIISLRNIQHDTIVLGGAILAIIDGKMCKDTIADLVNSLEKTYHMHVLREIYGTQDDNQNGDAIETIVRGLASPDVLVQKSIRLRLVLQAAQDDGHGTISVGNIVNLLELSIVERLLKRGYKLAHDIGVGGAPDHCKSPISDGG